MDAAKRSRLLVMGHLGLGALFAVAWGMQSLVFGIVFYDQIRSTVLGKVAVISSFAYAVLGVLWLIVGLQLRRGGSRGVIVALSVVCLLFVPFGVILSLPALLYAHRRP
jgi:hypothetical protein